MQLAFCLFKYFPYGGLQRDFLQFYQRACERGHQVRVYCIQWTGPKPDGIDIHFVPAKGLTNPLRNRRYAEYVLKDIETNPVDLVVGFNKMPGLDVYYAADSCYKFKAQQQRGWLYRQTPRYKHFAKAEVEVFGKGRTTKILLISLTEKEKFEQYYQTEPERMALLPPGIPLDRRAPDNTEQIRAEFRAEFGIKDHETLLLFIGSGFIKKGLDRAISALANLDKVKREKTRLFVVGQDKSKHYEQLAERNGIAAQISFLGGRDDIPRFLLGADCLVHPALDEAAGIVLLEALVAGLPVIVTDVCGYAHHIVKANSGIVLPSPFQQQQLDTALAAISDQQLNKQWKENALDYADSEDLYSMHETGIKIMEDIHRYGEAARPENVEAP